MLPSLPATIQTSRVEVVFFQSSPGQEGPSSDMIKHCVLGPPGLRWQASIGTPLAGYEGQTRQSTASLDTHRQEGSTQPSQDRALPPGSNWTSKKDSQLALCPAIQFLRPIHRRTTESEVERKKGKEKRKQNTCSPYTA